MAAGGEAVSGGGARGEVGRTEGGGTATLSELSYREQRAPAALAPWLACAWERRDGGGDAVRIVPDGAALRDGRMALADVWQDDGRRLAQRLDDADAADRTGLLLAALAGRAGSAALPDPLVRAAVDRLHDPRARIAALADEAYVSARQLRRRFESAVGHGPKRLARVLRLQRALGAARGGEELALAAATAGYADHAHFAHPVPRARELAGAPATALL